VSAADAILDATGRSVVANGFGATSLEAISRDAGLSRATVYRTFPGGRHEVLDAFLRRELDRFFEDLYEHIRHLSDLEEVLTEGLWYARRRIAVHPVLNLALVEDSTVLDSTLTMASTSLLEALSAFFVPYLDDQPDRAARAAYLARLALSYLAVPGTWNLSDRAQIRALVHCELTPHAREGHFSRPARVSPLPPPQSNTLQQQVAQALLEEFVAGGTVSMESVAQRADISRATLYRSFPGGRPSMVRLVFHTETSRVLSAVAVGLGKSVTLEEGLLSFLTTTWHHLSTHEGVVRLLQVNPGFVADRLRFEKGQRTLDAYTDQVAPLLARWVGRNGSRRIAELMLRVMFSYWLDPSEDVAIGRPASIAAFYDTHLAHAVKALADLPDA
jgi:AcrR family transcriptional regulator